MKTPLAEGAAMEDYFDDISLGVGEPTIEGPPAKKKNKTGPGGKMKYKHPHVGSFLRACCHCILLRDARVSGCGHEFLDLGLVKVEADLAILGFDSLLARLEERPPSNWDILASLDQYIEEIWTADYIQCRFGGSDNGIMCWPWSGSDCSFDDRAMCRARDKGNFNSAKFTSIEGTCSRQRKEGVPPRR